MRLLHVAQPIPPGGVPNVVSSLAAYQSSHGHDVHVACPPYSVLSDMCASSVAVHGWHARRQPGPSVPGEVLALRRVIEEVRPEVIHLHSAKAGLAGRLALRGRRPTVYQPHAWSFDAVQGLLRTATISWERAACRWTHRIICVSTDEEAKARQHGITCPTVVIPNGVDVSRIHVADEQARQDARLRLGLPRAAPIAVSIGRLLPQKGTDVLLSAWRLVEEAVSEPRLFVIGDGPLRADLERDASATVSFVGHSDDVATWIRASNVVVISSRYEAGLTLVAMEAMAYGRSVVTTDVEGMRDGIGDRAGAVVDVDDVHALAAAVTLRLGDRLRADSEGAVGRQIIETRFTSALTGDHLDRVYRAIANG